MKDRWRWNRCVGIPILCFLVQNWHAQSVHLVPGLIILHRALDHPGLYTMLSARFGAEIAADYEDELHVWLSSRVETGPMSLH